MGFLQSNLQDGMKCLCWRPCTDRGKPRQRMKEFFGERFLVQNDFLYPFALHPSEKDSFIINWANPLGIGCSTETIHTVFAWGSTERVRERGFSQRRFRQKKSLREYSHRIPACRQAGISPWFFCSTFFIKKKSGIKRKYPGLAFFHLQLDGWVFLQLGEK